jgi:hypothetical protein
MADFPNLDIEGATFKHPGYEITPTDRNYVFKTIGQKISIPRQYLSSPNILPQRAGININFPYEEGITATKYALDQDEDQFYEEKQTYIPNIFELSWIGVKSSWSKRRLATLATDALKRSMVKQVDAVKTYENSMLTDLMNTIEGSGTPLGHDLNVASSGTLTFKDIRKGGILLNKAGYYATNKNPFVCLINSDEAYDLISDAELTDLTKLYQAKTSALQKLDEKRGNLILETDIPFPLKVILDDNCDDGYAYLFDTYAGVQWAELQGFQGINTETEGEKGNTRRVWTTSLLAVGAVGKVATPATAGDYPGVVVIDI